MGSTTPSERRNAKTKRQGASFTHSGIAWMTTALFLFNLLTIYFFFQTTPGIRGAGSGVGGDGDGLNLYINLKGARAKAGNSIKSASSGRISNSVL